LESAADQPRWHVPTPEVAPDFITLVASGGWRGVLADSQRRSLERDVLPDFLLRQRWFGAKDTPFVRCEMHQLATFEGTHSTHPLTICEASAPGGDTQCYFLPLSAKWGSDHVKAGGPLLAFTLAKLRSGARVGALVDATRDDYFARDLLIAMGDGQKLEASDGQVEFSASPIWAKIDQDAPVRAVGAEQSNVSVIVDDRIMLKVYRRVRSGVQPELEVARFLTEAAHYPNTPEFFGAAEHVTVAGDRTALAVAFAYVPHQGDAWNVVVETLDRAMEDIALVSGEENANGVLDGLYVFPLGLAARLGERTGELHRAFTTPTTNPAFAPEPMAAEDIQRWSEATRVEAERALSELERMRGSLSDAADQKLAKLLGTRKALYKRIDATAKSPPMGVKTRIHGDYHLGQVLISEDDVVIIDFEGEPSRTLVERREKSSPLRDVAGMLRSLDYAASAAVERFAARTGEPSERVLLAANGWRSRASREFLQAYIETVHGMPSYPVSRRVAVNLLDLFLLQKAFYEIAYEAANRPAWLPIPLQGVLDLLEGRGPHWP
jgi:maltose alpha-D-glucosyltransferase / alpha-amylase